MEITVIHNGRTFTNWSPSDLPAKGVPLALIGAAVKALAKAEVAVFADGYRAKLASANPGKLAEYRIKEEIARDPSVASQGEHDMLVREANARGVSLEDLLADISAKATAYREIALLIGALEAEVGAAIAAIPDDIPDIETQIQNVLGAAKAQAETAFAEALALINGGS